LHCACKTFLARLAEVDMASETIKALLMITLFCGLQVPLPQLINSQAVERWRRATLCSHMRRSVTL
jgi:hypothetical protein